MRIVFLLQGERVPAARFRGLAIAEGLRRRGYDVLTFAPTPSVYGDWPVASPRLAALARTLRPCFVPAVVFPRLRALSKLENGDLVIVQRPLLELPVIFLEKMIARRHPVIFDFDDAIYLNFGGQRKIRALVALATHVTAGNAHLAAFAAAPDKTSVLPTVVDLARYLPSPPRATRGSEVVVGWTGLASNYGHLASAAAPIAQALRESGARFRIISDRPPPASLASLRAEYVPWRADTEIETLDALDIGVMPLPDGPRERGKCAFKLIQYMALGKCGLASPVGANREVVEAGENGLLPATDADWTRELLRLINDPEERERMGRAARARIAARYSLDAVLPQYEAVIAKAARAAHV